MEKLRVTVWSPRDSPRLRFVLDWLLGDCLGMAYHLTHDRGEAATATYALAYGWMEQVPSIHAGTLLWEEGIRPHTPSVQEWQGLNTLYFDGDSPCDIQFDVFSGIFYLLSRYEEYLPFMPDKHGRYPAQQSILYPALERPVVDEWVEAVRLFLEQVWGVSLPRRSFDFQPSYDIDIAWSYLFKGMKRTLGGLLADGCSMNWQRAKERLAVLRGDKSDPYDSFIWMFAQHMEGDPRPLYFVLAALNPSRFDKNISPHHPRMASLVRALSGSGVLGLHPSYNVSADRWKREQDMLQSISEGSIVDSRQHYIRLLFPQTYDLLLSCSITDDWSMGYSTCFGFRAGTSRPFPWYRLPDGQSGEGVMPLRIHPFCFMDTTAHFDLGLSAEAAFDRLRGMANRLLHTGGRLVTIMHNFSLGTDPQWKGWRAEYELFLQDIAAGSQAAAKAPSFGP